MRWSERLAALIRNLPMKFHPQPVATRRHYSFTASAFECSLPRSCTLIGISGTAGAWMVSTIGGFSSSSRSALICSAFSRSTVSAKYSIQPCAMVVSSRRGEHSTIASTTSPMIYTRPQPPNHATERTADRCMTGLKGRIKNYETSNARSRPPSLILLSLGVYAESCL